MNYAKRLVAQVAILAAFFIASPSFAQWQVPDHSVPVGRGSGTGFKSAAPGASSNVLISGGASADPTFRALVGGDLPAISTLSGNISVNQMNSGTNASGTTFWRGDGTWNAFSVLATRSVTSAPTITSADCGTSIINGTGSTGQFTITLPAASGFSNGCFINFINGDTAAGKKLSGFPTGILASSILYPKQGITVISNGTSWYMRQPQGRYLQGGLTLYVSNAGNNTNDCLSASTPCLSMGEAALRLYRDIDHQNAPPSINVACGIYAESLNIQGELVGANYFLIGGATTAAHCLQWRNSTGTGSYALQVGDFATVIVQNAWIECGGCTGTNYGIFMHQHSILDIFSNVEFGAMPGTQISCDSFARMNMPASLAISGSSSYFADLGPLCSMAWGNPASTITISGTPTYTTLIRAVGNAAVTAAGLNWTAGGAITAGQQFAITGSAYLDQTGVTWPSGSSAGSPAATVTPYGGVVK